MITVLYRDDCLVVCVKPVGALSEDKGESSVPALLRTQLDTDVFAVHRLDRAVGGVMVYSADAAWTGKLTDSLQKTGEKTYLAVAGGDPGESGSYTDLLYHDPKSNKTFVVNRERRGVREAKLDFQKKASFPFGEQTLSLVEVHLKTGRTHQIRTQFASRGMPLVGDRRYGSRIVSGVALWSAGLSFVHPKTKQHMEFYHAPPDVFPFNEINVEVYRKK